MYLVEIEKFKLNTFVIKFFLKKHKKNKHRYNLLSNEYKCRMVVMTIVNILLDVLRTNKDCNFAFIGSNTTDNRGNEKESKNKTKRFRVYRRVVENKIGPKTFSHFQSEQGSSYLLVNNATENVNDTKEKISNMFKREFPQLVNMSLTHQPTEN